MDGRTGLDWTAKVWKLEDASYDPFFPHPTPLARPNCMRAMPQAERTVNLLVAQTRSGLVFSSGLATVHVPWRHEHWQVHAQLPFQLQDPPNAIESLPNTHTQTHPQTIAMGWAAMVVCLSYERGPCRS
jgi:hypothetical protein